MYGCVDVESISRILLRQSSVDGNEHRYGLDYLYFFFFTSLMFVRHLEVDLSVDTCINRSSENPGCHLR